MRKRDWFECGARLLGLWQVIYGLDEGVTFGNAVYKLYVSSVTEPRAFLTHALAHAGIGLFLLLFAPAVVNAIYPPPDAETAEAPK